MVDDRKHPPLVLQPARRAESHSQTEEQEVKSHVGWCAPWSQIPTHDVGVLEDVLLNHQYGVTAFGHHEPLGNDDLPLRLIKDACLPPALAIVARLRSRAFHLPLPTSSATTFRSTFW